MGRHHIPHIAARFLSKVSVSGPHDCWEWKGAEKGNGYGQFNLNGETMGAHRAAYILLKGARPAPGQDVCHTCDNRSCVNPDHLFLGSRADNMADAKAKRRTRGGRRSHLPRESILRIADMLRAGVPYRQIADREGSSYSVVSNIKSGRSYAAITGFTKE
jgi:hypothetical protein